MYINSHILQKSGVGAGCGMKINFGSHMEHFPSSYRQVRAGSIHQEKYRKVTLPILVSPRLVSRLLSYRDTIISGSFPSSSRYRALLYEKNYYETWRQWWHWNAKKSNYTSKSMTGSTPFALRTLSMDILSMGIPPPPKTYHILPREMVGLSLNKATAIWWG